MKLFLLSIAILICIHSSGQSLNDTLLINEVVITATRSPRLVKNCPEIVRIIPRHDIQSANPHTVGEIMNSVTGINIEGGTGSGLPHRSIVNMNGFPASYNLVLVDGVRLLSDHIHTGQNLELVPTEHIERIEVIRGASSAQYGSDAMGGIVNIITRPPGNNSGSLTTSAGTYDTYSVGLSVAAAVNKNVSTSTWAGWNQSNGIEIIAPKSRIGNMGYTRLTFMNKVSIKADEKSLIHAHLNAVQYRMEWTDGDKYSHLYFPLLRYEYKINEKSGFEIRTGFTQWDAQQNTELNRVIQPEIHYHIQTGKKNTFFAGGDLRYNEFQRNKVEKNDQQQAGIYLQDEYTLSDKFIVMGAVRADKPEALKVVVTPKISLLYKPLINMLHFRATAGRGFHAPTVQELYEEGFGHSGRALRFGNPDLKPEYASTFNLGTEITPKPWMGFYINGYYNQIENMIIPIYKGAWEENPSKDVWMRENIHQATIYGTEAETRLIFKRLSISAGYSWSDNLNQETGRQLPYSPGSAINGKANYSFQINEHLNCNFYVSFKSVKGRSAWNWKPASGTEPDNPFGLITELKDYEKLDASVSIEYKEKIRFFFNAYNILEQDIETLDDAYTVMKGKMLLKGGMVYNF